MQGPLWEFASWVPFVGQNVAAVRATTEATHILVRDALPAIFPVLGAMQRENIRFEGGGFNLEPFRQALTVLPAVDAAFTQAQDKVAGIDRTQLLPIVDDAVGQVLDVIEDAAPISHTALAVLPTALTMLGEQGPRHVPRAVPEQRRDPRHRWRCCGGRVPACGGRSPRAGGQTGSTTFESGPLSEVQTLELPAETLALYDPEFAISSQNFTRTPNFPTAARLFQSKIAAQDGFRGRRRGLARSGRTRRHPLGDWRRHRRRHRHHRRERRRDPAERHVPPRSPPTRRPADAFFAATSATVFQKLVSGDWDLMQMLDVFAAPVQSSASTAGSPAKRRSRSPANWGSTAR